METNKNYKAAGTVEQKENFEEDDIEDEVDEKSVMSFEMIVREMYKDQSWNEYEKSEGKSVVRRCNRSFVRNLTELLGADYSKYLKNGTKHYKIPVKSEKFVRELIDPQGELVKVLNGEVVYEGIGVLEKIETDRINSIVAKDMTLSELRFKIYILFSECDSEKRDEVMVAFTKKYNPYYSFIQNGLSRLQDLFDTMIKSPHLDTSSCRTLYDDVERCMQDIYYAEKRSKMLAIFKDYEFIKAINKMEYYTRTQ